MVIASSISEMKFHPNEKFFMLRGAPVQYKLLHNNTLLILELWFL